MGALVGIPIGVPKDADGSNNHCGARPFCSYLVCLVGLGKYFRSWWLLRQIPLPELVRYSLLLGHIPTFHKQDEDQIWYAVKELDASPSKDKSLIRTVLGLDNIIQVVHSKHVPNVIKEPKPREIYKLISPWLGDGLLVSEGDKWFRNRKLLTPAFHYEILKGYVPVYNDCLEILLDKWTQSSHKGEPVLLFETLSLTSLDIILRTSFSYRSDCQTVKEQQPYVKACHDLVYLCSDRIMNPLYMIDSIYWLTPHGRKTKRACDFVHKHAEKVISDRKKFLRGENNNLSDVQKSKRYLDFLDILLKAEDEEGRGMSDLEIRNEVDTFMFVGHDTTTSGMSWTLYCLAQHPQHQDKVREEVRSILREGSGWSTRTSSNSITPPGASRRP